MRTILAMLNDQAGGSTQANEFPSAGDSRRRMHWLLKIGTLGAALAMLAGCEGFALRQSGADRTSFASPTASGQPQLVSPLASALIGGIDALPASGALDPAVDLLARPPIELEPLPPRGPGDLLQRLRASFSLTASGDAAYERELAWFSSHPDYLQRVFDRASPYLYYIADELYRRGMPAELALLPIVESAFDPFAYSRGRAAGLWQIIPGTGRRLGVKQDWWFDGRRDLLESTRAALDYLEALHERFDGDWLLAIAGYNSGGGNVARAIALGQAAGKNTDFWSIRPYLPKETRTYVPRLLALSSLVAAPKRFDVVLPVVPDAPQLTVVDTGGQIDMTLAAELAGLDVDALYRLNAGVNRWATDPSGPHRLVVPIANADTFRTGLAELGDRERVEWTRYRIQRGDTLIELAAEFATTPAVLRQVNGIAGNTIRAGDYLMIPHALESLDRYSQSVDARLARQQSIERDGERRTHVVRRGESLWTISRRYGVSVAALAKWNGMAPRDPLAIGRRLVVWTQPSRSEPQLTTVSRSVGADRIRRVNYVVRRGDSLSSIAQRFRVTVGKLVDWNDGISTRRYLQPGQHLVLYVNVAEQST